VNNEVLHSWCLRFQVPFSFTSLDMDNLLNTICSHWFLRFIMFLMWSTKCSYMTLISCTVLSCLYWCISSLRITIAASYQKEVKW
jgi:hypothetical protein